LARGQTLKISICIPCYNSEKTIAASIQSALDQTYPNKEVLILDDGSTDYTAHIAKQFLPKVRVIERENRGIGITLVNLMKEAKGKYVCYLCADDLFADPNVISDIVKQFDTGDPKIGVIGRQYYEFIDGIEGCVGVFRNRENILLSSCNPSGMAFRRDPDIGGTNKIFIEMPSIVKQYLDKGWMWTMFEYDSIAVRIHPGPQGNTGTKKSYYTGSMAESWASLVGWEAYFKVRFYHSFIQLKNRAPHLLWREIWLTLNKHPGCGKQLDFWLNAVIAVVLPGFILRELSKFYRHRLIRGKSKIMKRSDVCKY
jgi:glycosyltransferase involved in cell wall biosynthesis